MFNLEPKPLFLLYPHVSVDTCITKYEFNKCWLDDIDGTIYMPKLYRICMKKRKMKSFGSFQFKEKVFLRQQGSYILTVEAGKQLLLCADSGAEAALQAELTEIQEKWRAASVRLEEQKKKLAFLLKVSSVQKTLWIAVLPAIVSLRVKYCRDHQRTVDSILICLCSVLRICPILHELETFPGF